MGNSKGKFLNYFTRQLLLLLLLLVVAAGGLVYWRYYSANPPSALFSSADEQPPHWSHTEDFPVSIPLLNHTSFQWQPPLNKALGIWESSGLVDYEELAGGDFECYPIRLDPEKMNICNFSESGIYPAIAAMYVAPNNYIHGGTVALNDYYLFDPKSEYGNDIIRQKILCWGLGWTFGSPMRYLDPNDAKSCMNAFYTVETAANMQEPDEYDYRALKNIYSHQGIPSSSAVTYKMQQANVLLSQNYFGTLDAKQSNELVDYYVMDLGEGFEVLVMGIKNISGSVTK